MFRYFYNELWRFPSETSRPPPSEYQDRLERVNLLLSVPRALEPLLNFGLLNCIDTFLSLFTYMPFVCLFAPPSTFRNVQMIRMILLVSSGLSIQTLDMSRIYHLVRGQSVVKLYFFYNTLEMADRLLSAIGQDIIEHCCAPKPEISPSRDISFSSTCGRFALAVTYIFLHSLLFLFQVTTLNIAFNSHNKALFAIMLSNNFVEIKQAVFKRFESHALQRIAFNDAKERFYFLLSLLIISLRNMAEFEWRASAFFIQLLPYIIILLLSEVLVDYIKHVSIIRFNGLPVSLYFDFTQTLAQDYMEARNGHLPDLFDRVCRRTGLTPFSSAIVLIRTLFQTIKVNSLFALTNCILFYLCVVLLKSLIGIVIYAKAMKYTNGITMRAEKTRIVPHADLLLKHDGSMNSSPTRSVYYECNSQRTWNESNLGNTECLSNASEKTQLKILNNAIGEELLSAENNGLLMLSNIYKDDRKCLNCPNGQGLNENKTDNAF